MFDAHDRIVEPTVDRWMPERGPMNQALESDRRAGEIDDALPNGPTYLYAGRLTAHFGHFITESLCRLWPLIGGRREGMKILFHGPGDLDVWWAIPHVRDILAALRIGRKDVIHLDAPVRVPSLIVPGPSFTQQAGAHRAYGRLCRAIGQDFLAGRDVERSGRPIYLSKTRLPEGVRRIVNEDVVEAAMAAAGVEIAHPQELSLRDQIALIAGRVAITGTVGSAHHLSLFTPDGRRFEMLSPDPELNANFFIIDALAGNRARYHHPAETPKLQPDNPTFLVYQALSDPEGVAHELLDQLEPDRFP